MNQVIELSKKDRAHYEAFHNEAVSPDLHQSWEWGTFQQKVPGRGPVWRFAALDTEDKWVSTVQVIKYALPFGLCWLSVVRGPLYQEDLALEDLHAAIQSLGKKEKAVFIRYEWPRDVSPTLKKEWKRAHAYYQPRWTLLVDLKDSEEETLAQMKPKGRYNIKVARKKGVTVRETSNPKDVAAFYQVLKKTGGRDGFSIHSESYYQDFIMAGSKGEWASLFVSEYEGQVIGGILATFFGDTATYYYGASDHAHRKVMAPYLTQWTVMQTAKERGYKTYDFLGIAPPNEPKHPWVGITQFKCKFGGQQFKYGVPQEWVLKPFWYFLIKLRKRLRR
jgi:lipid II:glycine glycyltransferase (peptidoglycan interpeptide bridge formation enzyme)